jgi:hypothetical protein
MSPLRGVAKGNAFAQKVADYLGTERRVLNGSKDKGDLVHRTWTVEVKAPGRGRPLDLSTAMNEARIEAVNAATPDRYAVITRHTGYPIDESFFTIPLWLARQVIPDLSAGQLPLVPVVVDVPTGDLL